MTELLDAALLDNTQDHELEDVDFHNPVEVMGKQAIETTVVAPVLSDEERDTPHEFGGFAD